MQTIRTIVCQLDLTPEQQAEVDATLKAFADACNYIAGVAREIHSTNKVLVQKACYTDVRAKFGLSANLTIRAIARVCATLKVPAKMHSIFEPSSIDYDARIFSFREWDWTFSLTLLTGRFRLCACLGDFQRNALKGQHPTSATLAKRADGGYYLHVQIKEDAPESMTVADVLGVDLGIVNLATDSEGETFSGAGVDATRKRYGKRRRGLNQCSSKSAHRRLRNIRKRESRYRANQNHIISKRIVAKAKCTGCAIALEELQGIGTRTKARKPQRNRMKGWAFYQLRAFIEYKAQCAGVPVVAIDPRNTSRTCSKCNHCEKGNRKSQAEFVCKHCGFSLNADLNAAKNIRIIGLKSCSLTVP